MKSLLHAFPCLAVALVVSVVRADPPTLDESASITQHLQTDQQYWQNQRQQYQWYFKEAYQQFPRIPAGMLEAIAYVQSRWEHRQPTVHEHGHYHQMPAASGLFGLYDLPEQAPAGFADTLGLVSKASGFAREQIQHDARTQVLAFAAWFDSLLQQHQVSSWDAPQMLPVLHTISGLRPIANVRGAQVLSQYAQDSFAYDVWQTLDRGVDEHGVQIPERAVPWFKVFSSESLQRLRAKALRADPAQNRLDILVPGTESSPERDSSSTPRHGPVQIQSTDYGPALWVTSPYYGSRNGNAISAITVHTMQGSYAGSISWFTNNPYSVSAHYLLRSSDGQITQMVREANRANHVGSHNPYTIGLEHEGYVNSSSWYTSAMYNASAKLVKHLCTRYRIDCKSAYKGAASSGIKVLPTSVKIKGHQHFSSQTHTDPGIYWDWARYYTLINGTSGGSNRVLDNFETSEGHFNTSPSYSGSTVGIATSSTAERSNSIARNGQYSEQIKLIDNASSNADWAVRFLSGSGSPGNNSALSKAGGRVGFWVYTGASGMSAAISVDDSDGSERTLSKSIPANQWTYLEWKLDDSAQWQAWAGGNGIITASSVTLDAIWFFRAQTSYTVYVYIDDVQYRFEG